MESFLKAFVAYFVVVDPIGTSLVFNALTGGHDQGYGRRMAIQFVADGIKGLWGWALPG